MGKSNCIIFGKFTNKGINSLITYSFIFFSEIEGTYEIVVVTVSTLKEVINNTEWKTAQ